MGSTSFRQNTRKPAVSATSPFFAYGLSQDHESRVRSFSAFHITTCFRDYHAYSSPALRGGRTGGQRHGQDVPHLKKGGGVVREVVRPLKKPLKARPPHGKQTEEEGRRKCPVAGGVATRYSINSLICAYLPITCARPLGCGKSGTLYAVCDPVRDTSEMG